MTRTPKLTAPAVLTLCILGSACAGIEAGRSLTPLPQAELIAIQQAPDQTGEQIDEGRVSSLAAHADDQRQAQDTRCTSGLHVSCTGVQMKTSGD